MTGVGQRPLHQPARAYPEDSEVRIQPGKPHKNLNRSTGGGDGRTVRLSGGKIILWTIGATMDAWREELRYRVDWLKGPSLADDREGRVSIVYTRDPGPPVLAAAQFFAPAWAVPTGGKEPEKEEVGSLPDLHDGTESEGSSQELEGEAVDEGPEDDLPGDLAINRS
jgi:hypothetical protein